MSEPHYSHRSFFPFAATTPEELAQERRDRKKRLQIMMSSISDAERAEFNRLAKEEIARCQIERLVKSKPATELIQ